MRCRNRLWKKQPAGDVTVIKPDGSRNIIPLRLAPKPTLTEKQEIENERDNQRYHEWRAAILTRDRETCVLCQEKRWIQVHHVVRWADDLSRRYDLQNGACLCIPCHTKHHGPEMKAFPAEITARLMEYIGTLYGESQTIQCADKSIPAHQSSVAGA